MRSFGEEHVGDIKIILIFYCLLLFIVVYCFALGEIAMLKIRGIRWLTLLVVMIFSVVGVAGLMVMPAYAQNGEIGNVCVGDYGGVSCTANDVRLESLTLNSLIQGCTLSTVDGQYYMTATFNAQISASGSPDRYDVGFYLALDGGSAYTGDMCYHGFLTGTLSTNPPYGDDYPFGSPNMVSDTINGPWWDGGPSGNICGDLASDTEAVLTLPPLRVPCVDGNSNTASDIHVCTSWKNGNSGPQGTCTGVSEAIPGTGSKCGCTTLDFPFTTTAITSLDAMAGGNSGTPIAPFAGIVLALATITLLTFSRRRQTVM